jgi:Ice-binding-like
MNKVLVIMLLVTMVACGNSTSTHPQNLNGKGPAPVDLKSASSFAVLTKSGITDVPTSVIVGDVGTSPITGAANNLTCAEVTGKTYSVDAAGPLPCRITNATLLTTAIQDMMTAYTNAAGRTLPTATNLGGGEIGGLTIAPGLYKWGTGVTITTDVTLSGGPNDVWIFQIPQTLNQASATNVVLSGGAQAKNVFWQTFGDVTIQANAQFNGVILSQTSINLKTGASVNGQLLAQTQVTLEQNAVTQ